MENRDLLSQTAQIVSSHLSNNPVTQDQIPALIREVYGTLTNLGVNGINGTTDPGNEEQLIPAVPIKRSVFPDHIVCLEDGKKLKMLKRHLMTSYQMTPDDYRKRWNLPYDYPMVAPNYAQTRSSLAKKAGLGRRFDTSSTISSTDPAANSNPQRMAPGPMVRQIPEGKRGPGRPRKAA